MPNRPLRKTYISSSIKFHDRLGTLPMFLLWSMMQGNDGMSLLVQLTCTTFSHKEQIVYLNPGILVCSAISYTIQPCDMAAAADGSVNCCGESSTSEIQRGRTAFTLFPVVVEATYWGYSKLSTADTRQKIQKRKLLDVLDLMPCGSELWERLSYDTPTSQLLV